MERGLRQVVETAHSVGLRTTSTDIATQSSITAALAAMRPSGSHRRAGRVATGSRAARATPSPSQHRIMFGHVDTPVSWARHLQHLRSLQARTGGITEFVPLPFVHMESPVFLRGGARRGPTLRECVLMHAVGRIALHPLIPNIQASWVKMGPEQAAKLLHCGANDMGGVLMNESITRAAGAEHGQEVSAHDMEQLIQLAGRIPVRRNTFYGHIDSGRVTSI
ncbi:hypothetical protein CYMTET_32754 [Cymbomonas tetramitiformis]|uniref:CofH/MqnC-like C-terminal domain-containing protein n=1 Tax=Cymbomonas tetramitiformis TaxID=36881 RepID=A0AAE0FF12_9CHLO|nr:hypothetical protein CYMTET_32754 [Cymbomonas tetramitiformis]